MQTPQCVSNGHAHLCIILQLEKVLFPLILSIPTWCNFVSISNWLRHRSFIQTIQTHCEQNVMQTWQYVSNGHALLCSIYTVAICPIVNYLRPRRQSLPYERRFKGKRPTRKISQQVSQSIRQSVEWDSHSVSQSVKYIRVRKSWISDYYGAARCTYVCTCENVCFCGVNTLV